MNSKNYHLQEVLKELKEKNKEKEGPYAERLVSDLKCNSKKNKI